MTLGLAAECLGDRGTLAGTELSSHSVFVSILDVLDTVIRFLGSRSASSFTLAASVCRVGEVSRAESDVSFLGLPFSLARVLFDNLGFTGGFAFGRSEEEVQSVLSDSQKKNIIALTPGGAFITLFISKYFIAKDVKVHPFHSMVWSLRLKNNGQTLNLILFYCKDKTNARSN